MFFIKKGNISKYRYSIKKNIAEAKAIHQEKKCNKTLTDGCI